MKSAQKARGKKGIYSIFILMLMVLLAAGTVVFAKEGRADSSYSLTIMKRIDLGEIDDKQAAINTINDRGGYTFKIIGTVNEEEVEKIVTIDNFKLENGYGISSAKVSFGSPATISVIELITSPTGNNAENGKRRTPVYDSQAPVATPSESIDKDQDGDSSEIPTASPSDLASNKGSRWNLFSLFRNGVSTPSNMFKPEVASPSMTSRKEATASSEVEDGSSFQITDSNGDAWNMTSPQFQSSMNVNNNYAILSISKDNGRIQIRKSKANEDDENIYTFKITQTDFNDHSLKEEYFLDIKAGESGELTDLPRGYYRVEEEKAPNGFFLDVKNPNIEIKPEDGGHIKISDGNAKLTITAGGTAGDGNTHNFTITGPNGYRKDDIIIESQGTYVLKQLPQGDYTINEVTYAGTGGFTVETTRTSSKTYPSSPQTYTFKAGIKTTYRPGLTFSDGDYLRVKVSNINGPSTGSKLTYRIWGIWYGEEEKGEQYKDFTIKKYTGTNNVSTILRNLHPEYFGFKFFDSNKVTTCNLQWILYHPYLMTYTSKTGVKKTVIVDEPGEMTISKPADNNPGAEHVTYHFTVTDTKTNAVQKIDLKAGESKTLKGLAAGNYTVEEALVPRGPVGFTLSEEDREATTPTSGFITGTVKGSGSTLILRKPASAEAVQARDGQTGSNDKRLYHFTVTLPDNTQKTVALKAGEEKSLAELLGISELIPGDYFVVSTDDKFSGFGMTYNDSRTVAILDQSSSAVVNITNSYNKEKGSYRVVHEYYYDDGTSRTLEGTSEIVMRLGQELDSTHTSKNVTQVPNYGGRVYGYIGPVYGEMLMEDGEYSTSDYDVIPGKESVTATRDGEEIIILQYVRTPATRPTGTYRVVHEYYLLDQSGQHLEGRSSVEEVEGELPVNQTPSYDENDVEKKFYSDVSGVNRKYSYYNAAYGLWSAHPSESYSPDPRRDCVHATQKGEEIIILRYVRAAASYNVVHEYYLRVPAKGGTGETGFDSESDSATDNEFEPGSGSEDADITEEIFDYQFEGRSSIEIVGAPVDSTHTGGDVDQISTFKPYDQEYQYKHYEFGYGFLNESEEGYLCQADKELAFSTEAGNEIIILRYYREGETPDEPDKPNPPDKPDKPDRPGPGGSGDDDDDDDHKTETPSDPGTPETTETVTPDNPQETSPDRPAELPDPNDPDSPERVTIWEDGVPKTYVKTWDPVKQEWVYILDTETPLDRMLPKTGGRTPGGTMALLCLVSLAGISLSLHLRKKEDN